MTWLGASVGALALVAATVALGFWLRRRDGRIRATDALLVRPADVATTESFGDEATLLQFSTEFCARCPQTRALLGSLASERAGVRHFDIDLTHRPDLARRFSVLQTPTTLVLDRDGVVRARIGGAPDRRAVLAQLDTIIGSAV